jgi:hypothetical protein
MSGAAGDCALFLAACCGAFRLCALAELHKVLVMLGGLALGAVFGVRKGR